MATQEEFEQYIEDMYESPEDKIKLVRSMYHLRERERTHPDSPTMPIFWKREEYSERMWELMCEFREACNPSMDNKRLIKYMVEHYSEIENIIENLWC